MDMWSEMNLVKEGQIVARKWRLWSGSEVGSMEGHGEVQVQQYLTICIYHYCYGLVYNTNFYYC
jgi:hypothetical protein